MPSSLFVIAGECVRGCMRSVILYLPFYQVDKEHTFLIQGGKRVEWEKSKMSTQ